MRGPASIIVFLLIVLLPSASCQSRIITPDIVTEGGKVTFMCDASKVTITDFTRDIGTLTIAKQMSSIAGRNVSENDFRVLANYSVMSVPGVAVKSGVYLPGRNVTYLPSGGGTGFNNKDSMKLQLDINVAMCSDTGVYFCVVQYTYMFQPKLTNATQNLTIEAGISRVSFTIQPNNTANIPNQSLVPNESDEITLTCSAHGPNSAKIVWRLSTPKASGGYNPSQNYPTRNEITDSAPKLSGSVDGCVKFVIMSVLKTAVTSAKNGYKYTCVITDKNGNEAATRSVTTGVANNFQTNAPATDFQTNAPATDSQTNAPATDFGTTNETSSTTSGNIPSSGSHVPVTAATFSGCLVVIAMIASHRYSVQ